MLAHAITDARVGGDFWRSLEAEGSFRTLIRAPSRGEAEQAIERCGARPGGPILLSVPARRQRPVTEVRNGIFLLHGPVDPWALLDRVQCVIAPPQDDVRLLAAAAGCPVLDLATAEAVDPAGLRAELAGALAGFGYSDPFSGHRIDALEWIELLGGWRRTIDANRTIAATAGIAGWKRRTLRRFLWSDSMPRKLRRSLPAELPAELPEGSGIAVWPSRAPQGILQRAAERKLRILRVEDGFIRSVGLGAHLHLPHSIVVDARGIYYDPASPSDLEHILSEAVFTERLVGRASALIDRLVRGGVTKYAAGGAQIPAMPAGVRRILVPGQVEDDLSVRLGGAGVQGNLDLLRRVRAAEPGAWILYRPHPDVTAGLRKGHVPATEALRYADAILAQGSMAGLLDQVDCVHVLTSLAGFEALLRGREVVTHGQPFYAGWGLTTDLAPDLGRRRRRLTVPELAAGALILYPRYLDPVTRLQCPPEVVIRRHLDAPAARPRLLHRLRSLQGRMSIAGRRLAGATA